MNNQKKKRNFTAQFKTQLVLEYLSGRKSQAEICRENLIGSNLLGKWVRQFQEKAPRVFEDISKQDQSGKRIEKLEQIIGKQAIEIDFLKRGLRRY